MLRGLLRKRHFFFNFLSFFSCTDISEFIQGLLKDDGTARAVLGAGSSLNIGQPGVRPPGDRLIIVVCVIYLRLRFTQRLPTPQIPYVCWHCARYKCLYYYYYYYYL